MNTVEHRRLLRRVQLFKPKRGEREYLQVNALLVHRRKAARAHVQQLGANLLHGGRNLRVKGLRRAEKLRGGDVFFERDRSHRP